MAFNNHPALVSRPVLIDVQSLEKVGVWQRNIWNSIIYSGADTQKYCAISLMIKSWNFSHMY